MRLIASYRNAGYEALADGVIAFFDRRPDLQRRGVAFSSGGAEGQSTEGQGTAAAGGDQEPDKISTDISLVAIDRSDPEAFALAEVIVRGVTAGLNQYLKERPLLRQCCPEQALFVNPIFNLQRYAPGEGFRSWHCDWTLSEEATEPNRRVLAWILYGNSLPEGGTEFHWQEHHEEAERGKLVIFPAGLSHIHRGRVSPTHTKTIATGWINAGRLEDYLARLAEG
ncbi:2OG-Fe(II) oxygenase [Synechococcus sp. CCY9202]|uniref:2OG-Fe(II) oxygenase n=1 Tax=Synechococcus sp. CCY9202 TaxID=174698 RepID=UPI002B1ED141|nr:2OG-Fe(II) oxygenase [Synechococcus sp. CCY9202]MEA5423681.1 2OG-Fe(II) oxygenase [Synechococcus sp. CCY9202]